MEDNERASIVAEAKKQIARAKRLIEERDQSLRQQGIDPEKLRERVKAALRDNPEMQRKVDEARAQVQCDVEQSKAHEGFYAAAPVRRRKAPRSTI